MKKLFAVIMIVGLSGIAVEAAIRGNWKETILGILFGACNIIIFLV